MESGFLSQRKRGVYHRGREGLSQRKRGVITEEEGGGFAEEGRGRERKGEEGREWVSPL